jgi:cytoskeleton protein RodZ
MPEIGATLREARMRARIDISEIEAETKIRAKYLRALENEEWGLLPGPTFVRSFLRTYAEALGLDAKLLLEEYKLRHERPSDHDLMPIGPPRQGRPRRRARVGGVPPWFVVGVLIVGLLVALFALGKLLPDGGDGSNAGRTTPTQPTTKAQTTATTTPKKRSTTSTSTAAKKFVRLRIEATGQVFTCLRGAGGQLLVRGVTLEAGDKTATFRRSGFFLRLGNGNARLRVNGKLRNVEDVSPIGLQITRSGHVQRVALAKTSSCA